MPNIFVISLDAARADFFSNAGHQARTTPFLDEFARNNITFQNAYAAAPWTLPSVASLLTGLLPFNHSVNLSNPAVDGLMTFDKFLKKEFGYWTFATTANPWISEETVLKNFDYVDKIWQLIKTKQDSSFKRLILRERLNSEISVFWSSIKGKMFFANIVNSLLKVPPIKYKIYDAKRTNKSVIKQLKTKAGTEPFFYYIHYKEPHAPYTAPKKIKKKFMNKEEIKISKKIPKYPMRFLVSKEKIDKELINSMKKMYKASLYYVDKKVSELIDWIKRADLFNNSIIVITSDHGEHFGEHGFFDHQYSLYEPLLHIPLIMHFPSEKKPRVEKGFIQNIDVFPTILNKMKVKVSLKLDGINYFGKQRRKYCIAQFSDPAPSISVLKKKYPNGFFKHLNPEIYSIKNQRYKLICYGNGHEELFDVIADPLENKNIISEKKEVANKLKKIYEKSLFKKKKENKEKSSLTENTKMALKGLGYL